jgi:hypothetical protein
MAAEHEIWSLINNKLAAAAVAAELITLGHTC